jgi:hypothetical protein
MIVVSDTTPLRRPRRSRNQPPRGTMFARTATKSLRANAIASCAILISDGQSSEEDHFARAVPTTRSDVID